MTTTFVLQIGLRTGVIMHAEDVVGAVIWCGLWGCAVPRDLKERIVYAAQFLGQAKKDNRP